MHLSRPHRLLWCQLPSVAVFPNECQSPYSFPQWWQGYGCNRPHAGLSPHVQWSDPSVYPIRDLSWRHTRKPPLPSIYTYHRHEREVPNVRPRKHRQLFQKPSVQCTAPNSVLAILAKRLWLISVSPPDWANAPVVTPEASKSSSLMLFIIICHLFFSL